MCCATDMWQAESNAIAVMRCLSVCLSVTFVDCVKTSNHIFKFFSSFGNQAILVFPDQTASQYSYGNPRTPLTGASNAGGVGKISILNEYLALRSVTAAPWLVCGNMQPSFCWLRVLDDQATRAVHSHGRSSVTAMYSARPTKCGLALYTVMVVRESCVWQQGSKLRRRQQNRIELYVLINPKP